MALKFEFTPNKIEKISFTDPRTYELTDDEGNFLRLIHKNGLLSVELFLPKDQAERTIPDVVWERKIDEVDNIMDLFDGARPRFTIIF